MIVRFASVCRIMGSLPRAGDLRTGHHAGHKRGRCPKPVFATAANIGVAALALALSSGAALAADAPAPSPAPQARPGRTFYIAPGNPKTVGQGGAVVGVVPHQATPAPRGSMATFGGLLGTGAPGAATPAVPPVAGAPAAPR